MEISTRQAVWGAGVGHGRLHVFTVKDDKTTFPGLESGTGNKPHRPKCVLSKDVGHRTVSCPFTCSPVTTHVVQTHLLPNHSK